MVQRLVHSTPVPVNTPSARHEILPYTVAPANDIISLPEPALFGETCSATAFSTARFDSCYQPTYEPRAPRYCRQAASPSASRTVATLERHRSRPTGLLNLPSTMTTVRNRPCHIRGSEFWPPSAAPSSDYNMKEF